jgi:hypothetical protein
MMNTRLTVHPLLYLGLCNWLLHKIFLRLFSFQDDGVLCGFRAGASGDAHDLAIKDLSAGVTRFADRDAIVERYEEGVGIPVKRRMWSAMRV